jgi:biotin carboxyl carrier protein
MVECLYARVEPDGDAARVCAPAVGVWIVGVRDGQCLSGGAPLGALRVLNRIVRLELPPGCGGVVRLDPAHDRAVPVAWGQALCRLEHRPAAAGEAEAAETDDRSAPEAAADGHLVASFTTGMFYLRPGPGDPPFVREGDRVERGAVLGLIEVMKSFNQVLFTGAGGLAYGRIGRVLARDGQEVRSGEPLFEIVGEAAPPPGPPER